MEDDIVAMLILMRRLQGVRQVSRPQFTNPILVCGLLQLIRRWQLVRFDHFGTLEESTTAVVEPNLIVVSVGSLRMFGELVTSGRPDVFNDAGLI